MAVNRFEETIREFDAINSQDPHKEIENGKEMPKELLYGHRMTKTLEEFYPEASEELRLAARCQHIKRWAIPRENYPMDRKGYLLWRTKLKKFHGELAASIMKKHGYDDLAIQKVTDLLEKKRLRTDKEAQALEDVVCLVFLKYYFDDFITKHDEQKLVDIVKKTWNKMSDDGHKAALAMPYQDPALNIIQKALS